VLVGTWQWKTYGNVVFGLQVRVQEVGRRQPGLFQEMRRVHTSQNVGTPVQILQSAAK